MESVHRALGALGLQGRVNVTTAHSLDIMGVSFPPSAGAFHPAALAHLQPFLGFLSAMRSPFLINCYPYFAYKDDPARVPLQYVLFQPNAGVADPHTGLRYDNMLYAQVDAVYAAIQALGYTDVEVKVSETGRPRRARRHAAAAGHARRRLRLRALQREPQARPGVGAQLRALLPGRHARLQRRPARLPPADARVKRSATGAKVELSSNGA